MFKNGFELPHRALPFRARELVDLRRHDGRCVDCVPQPRPRGPIAFEARVPRVHQEQSGSLRPFSVKKRPGQLVECPGRVAAATGITVTRKVHEVEPPAALSRDAVDVGEPGLAGCGAGARNPPPDQRVDQARLADIRPSNERDGRLTLAGEVCRTRGARDESGVDLQ
jgi:hypothetical protein